MALERLRSIESGLDISISTFPHQVEMNRIRRRIATHRDVLAFFRSVGDIVENFDELRRRYTMFHDLWYELRHCIEHDIRERIDSFLRHVANIPPTHEYPNLQNGIAQGHDANTANFILKTLRNTRANYVLRNDFVSARLLSNGFYATASEQVKQLLTDFIYCTIVFRKSGALTFSFDYPHASQIPDELFRPRQEIVLFEEEYEDRAPHVAPIVPFLHYGGTFTCLDCTEYNMALPFPMHPLPHDIPHLPRVVSDDHLTSILHDHDALFRVNTVPLDPLSPPHVTENNNVNLLAQPIFESLSGTAPVTIPNYFMHDLHTFLMRRNHAFTNRI